MPEWDVLITNVHLATMTGPARYGAVHNGAIALEGDTIAWVGPLTALPAGEARDAVDGGDDGSHRPSLTAIRTWSSVAAARKNTKSASAEPATGT